MDIKVISSGSHGNAYLVNTTGKRILIECGLTWKKLLTAMEFELPNLCLISHEHGDHAKSAIAIARAGVKIICSNGTAEAIGLKKHQYITKFEDAELRIIPLKAIHDTAEPNMFVVDDKVNKDRLFFATDTESIPHTVDGITHLMIETNWSEYTMDADCHYQDRVRLSHQSLENAMDFVEKMDQSRLVSVQLIHLSSQNSDSEFFWKKMAESCGAPILLTR